jgi:DNA modification methylase
LEVNKIYHNDWMNNQLPDKSVQLIIADPPYFEVKGSFDFVWKSFDDYLKDVEKWAIECKEYSQTMELCFGMDTPKKRRIKKFCTERILMLYQCERILMYSIERSK